MRASFQVEIVEKILDAVLCLLKKPSGWEQAKKEMSDPQVFIDELRSIQEKIDRGEDLSK